MLCLSAAIRVVEHLNRLTHLTALDVSDNKITRFEGLAQLLQLARLDCANNELYALRHECRRVITPSDAALPASSTVDTLCACPSIATLDISNNRISDWVEVEKLASLPALRSLFLHGNPIASEHAYRDRVIACLPQLQALDGQYVRCPRLSWHLDAPTHRAPPRPLSQASASLSPPQPEGSGHRSLHTPCAGRHRRDAA